MLRAEVVKYDYRLSAMSWQTVLAARCQLRENINWLNCTYMEINVSERTTSRIRPTFRPSRRGIAQVLGDLEKDIMEALWRLGDRATVTQTLAVMKGAPRAYHTVTTVMVRLCDKGLLERRRRGGVWHYGPRLSRDEFRQKIAEEVLAGVFALAPESAINSMLDLVDASNPAGLDQLTLLIEKKRRERGRRK